MKISAKSQYKLKNAEMINFSHYGYQLTNFKRDRNCDRVPTGAGCYNLETKLKKSVNLKILVLSALNAFILHRLSELSLSTMLGRTGSQG